jgi:ribosomal protein S18 acetylase RimI-like enzyme
MGLEIRLGTVEDIEALGPLWMAMVEHHRGLVGEQWTVRTAEEAWGLCLQQYQQWLAEGSGILLVARLDTAGPFVGYAVCRLIPSGPTFDLGAVRGEVDSLVVAEGSRGAGAGTALLNACRDELRRRGVAYWSVGVVEANRGATALYERLGFRPWVRTMLAPVEDSQ